MAKYTIEDTTLTSIGNAIRAKNNSEELIKPSDMPAAIEAIDTVPEEAFILGNMLSLSYMFHEYQWQWFWEKYKDKLSTNNIYIASHMFDSNRYIEEIPFDLNCNEAHGGSFTQCFYGTEHLKTVPYIVGKVASLKEFLYNSSVENIPEDWADKINWEKIHTVNYEQLKIFSNAPKLKRIPASLMAQCYNGPQSIPSYTMYDQLFMDCYCLLSIDNIPVQEWDCTDSDAFRLTFRFNDAAKEITFANNEDGTAKTANWCNQTIYISQDVGYATSYSNVLYQVYGSSKQVTNSDTYAALKDTEEWWTADINYSRYNHNSAVNTINSLPDTADYITSSGGRPNTVVFKGAAGALTDGGAINTLTEEEIAVATAKGWTVSYV